MRRDTDRQYLKILAILHYALAAKGVVAGCVPFIHLSIGIAILSGAFDDGPNPPPREVGVLFTGIAICIIATAWTLATCTLLAGRGLATYRRYRFCMIVAALECVWLPLGTALGIVTILALRRPGVKALFEGTTLRALYTDDFDDDDEPAAEPAATQLTTPHDGPDDGAYQAGPAPR